MAAASSIAASATVIDGWSVPDFIPLDVLLERFEPPIGTTPIVQPPKRVRIYEYADESALPHVTPDEWLCTAKRRRKRTEWHAVADYLAAHADWTTGRGVRCSVARMAGAIGRHRVNCNSHVRKLVSEGWLRQTGKARHGVIVYALAVPPER